MSDKSKKAAAQKSVRRLTEQSVLFAAGVKSPPRAEVALRAHADILNVVFQVDGHLFALKDELAVQIGRAHV